MQDRYTGDIGDFGKLGLLRALYRAGLKIGVNWYLTLNEENGDGELTQYLTKREFIECDTELCDALKEIIDSKDRRVIKLQNDKILPAVFFSETLDFSSMNKTDRRTFRSKWHKRAIEQLCVADVDIVFLDPDNGIMVKTAEGTKRENKFVTEDEILDYFDRGKSVIYYQHKARKGNDFYLKQQKNLLAKRPEAFDCNLWFSKTSHRYYFFLIHEEHRTMIESAVKEMLSSKWERYFKKL